MVTAPPTQTFGFPPLAGFFEPFRQNNKEGVAGQKIPASHFVEQ